jgi:hypothetical protein
MHRSVIFVGLILSALLLSGQIFGADPDLIAADERLLQTARIGTDGPSLVEYFRKQKPAGEQLEKIQALIRRLGDRSYDVREKACRAAPQASGDELRPGDQPARRELLATTQPRIRAFSTSGGRG